MSPNDLGRPYTADFIRLQGEDGRSLFPEAGAARKTSQNFMEHNFVIVDSERSLAAHASAWGLGGGMDMLTKQRYASYRALQIDSVFEIDDATAIRNSPPYAVYYPWKIYVGRSYEVLFEGDADRFHAGVQAKLIAWSAEVSTFASENRLTQRTVGHGLTPSSGRAIFAKTQEQIERNYEQSSEAVPILVEWREIPGRRGNQREITWHEPKQDCSGQPGCSPCLEWAFDYVEWKIQDRKASGAGWDADGSDPDVVVTLNARGSTRSSPKRQTLLVEWKLDPPLRVESGTRVSLSGVDRDILDHDRIATLHTNVKDNYEFEHGRAKVFFESGGAFMRGTCLRP